MGGGCVAKERKEIESKTESGTESGTEFEITFIFWYTKMSQVSKLKVIQMSLSFKAEKKGKKAKNKINKKREKKKEDDLQRGKNKQRTMIFELTL